MASGKRTYRPKAWEWAVWIACALLVTVPDIVLAVVL